MQGLQASPTHPHSSVQSFTPINVQSYYPPNDTAVPEFTPPTQHSTLGAPEAGGGCEWPGGAYSPRTGFVYFGTSYFPEEVSVNPSNPHAFGSTLTSPVPGIAPREDYGIFGAINTATGKVAWTDDSPQPAVSGMVVGGNLVYFGEGNGRLLAANARTGTILWSFDGTPLRRAEGPTHSP